LVEVLLVVKIVLAGGWLVVGVGDGWRDVSVVTRRSLVSVSSKHLVCRISEVVWPDIVVTCLLLLLLIVVLISAKLLLSLVRVQTLHSQMLYGRVLPIHVKRLVLRHGQHLLEVGLDCGAVLVVDGVTVADRGALVLPDIRLGHVEPGVWQAGAFRRRRRMLCVIGWYETWWRSTVGRRHVDTSSNTSSWTPGLRGVITKALLLLIHCYLVFLFFTNF